VAAGARWFAAAAVVVLGACASTPRSERVGATVEVSPDFGRVLEATLAVAPTVPGPTTATLHGDLRRVALELHDHLYAGLPATRLVGPDSVGARLETGDVGLRPLVRRLALGDRLLPADGEPLRRALGQRYVLLTWIAETVVTGSERPRTDLDVSDFNTDQGLASYRRIEGALHGAVVDLERAEVLWRAREPYRGRPVFDDAPFGTELDRLRASAATTLAMTLESS